MGANVSFKNKDVFDRDIIKSSFFLDFGYDKIIYFQNNQNIDKVDYQVIEKNVKINYKNKEYIGDKCNVQLLIGDKKQLNLRFFLVQVYIVKSKGQNILGLGPNSDYLQENEVKAIIINLYSNNVYYDDISVLNNSHNFQVDNEENFHYIQSNLIYKYGVQQKRKSQANFCMHDVVDQQQYYFISGPLNFLQDWNFFKQQLEDKYNVIVKDQFKFFIQGNKPENNFSVTYDMFIFQFYNKKIFDSFASKTLKNCQLFFGDFFYHRSGFQVNISRENGVQEITFSTNEQFYIDTDSKNSLNIYLIFVILFVVLFVIFTGGFIYINKQKKPLENKWDRNFYVKRYEKLINQFNYQMDEKYFKDLLCQRQNDLNEQESLIVKMKQVKKRFDIFQRVSSSLQLDIRRTVVQKDKQNYKKRSCK